MKVAAPHWLSAVLGGLSAVAAALSAQNTFPSLTPALAAIAGLLALAATPTLVHS